MKVKIPNSIRKATNAIRKHSPEILTGIGVVGTLTGTVLACRATLKAADIVFDMHDSIGPDDDKKEIRRVKTEAYCDVAKAYAPSAIIIGLSIGTIFAGNYIQRKRCAELAAAYTTLNQAYQNYRKAVREKFGVDVDRELAYGTHMETIETVGEDGKKKKEKIAVVDPNSYSPYARFFDDASRQYDERNPENNLNFLVLQQDYWNKILKIRGYVYYNEVLRSLEIPETSWTNVGWVYDKSNKTIDSQIDFGIFQCNRPKNRDFVNGYEPVIILDFNVDGDISYIFRTGDNDNVKHLPSNWAKEPSRQLRFIGGGNDNE